MPPAMVGIRSPAAVAAAASNLSPPRNPSKGQISAPFSSFAFESMDRPDLGLGLDGSFVSPAPSFPSGSAPAKPSSAAGLSKPRLVKVRKHLGSGRAKPAVIADPEDAAGFNPFRPGSYRVDENLRDSTARSFVFGAGSDAGAFVFGSGAKKNLDSRENSVKKDSDGLNLGNFETVKSESASFLFGAGSEVNSGLKNLEGDGAFSVDAERGEFSGSVYEGRVKKSSVARGSSIGKDSVGVTLGGNVSAQFEGATFGFGAGSVVNSGARGIADDHAFSMNGKGGDVSGAFVLDSGLKKSSGYQENWAGEDVGAVNYGGFESMKSEGVGFAFGAGATPKQNVGDLMFSLGSDGKRSLKNSSVSSLASVGSEKLDSTDFMFAAGSVSSFSKENVVPENKIDNVFFNASKGSRNTSPDVFVFGVGTEGSYKLRSKSSENSEGPKFANARFGMSETTAFAFNADAAQQAEKKNIGLASSNSRGVQSGNVQSGECCFAGEKGVTSDAKLFGSDVEQNFRLHENFSLGSDVGSKLPDEMRKLNLQNSGSESRFEKTKENDLKVKMDEENNFIFGTTTNASGSFGGIGVDMLPEEIKKLNIGSGTPSDAGVFVFESGIKGSSYLNESSSLDFDMSSSSNLPDETRKLNLQNSSSDYGFEKRKQIEDNSYIFGANTNDPSSFGGIEVNVLPEELKKLNIGSGTPSDAGIFVCGTSVKGNSKLNENSSLGSDGGSFSKLPDEMKKLNLQKFDSDEGFEKTKQTNQRAEMDGKNNFMFGAKKNAPSSFGGTGVNLLPEELKKLDIGSGAPSDAGIFVLGSGVKGNSYLSENSSLGSDMSSFSKLPDEMRKLNLQNSHNEEGFEKTNHTDQSDKMDRTNNFMFGANTKGPSFFGGSEENLLPEEMRNLNIGNDAPSQSMESKSTEYPPGAFIFGGNVKKSSFPSQTSSTSSIQFDKSTSSEINATKDLNADDSRNDDSFTRAKDMFSSFKASATTDPREFSFGSCSKLSGNDERTAVNALHDDMELKISIEKENLIDNFELPDASDAHVPTSAKCTLQAGNQDINSWEGSIPQSKEHSSYAAAVPLNSSSLGPGQQYGGSNFAFTSMHESFKTTPVKFPILKQEVSGLYEAEKLNMSIGKENLVDNSQQADDSYAHACTSFQYIFQENQGPGSRKCSTSQSTANTSNAAAKPLNLSSLGQDLPFGSSEFAFTSTREGRETTSMQFRTPKQDASGLHGMKKFNVINKKKNLVVDSEQEAASAAYAPSSVKYTFQAESQGASSRNYSIPPSEAYNSFGAATPLNPSSFGQGLQYGASNFSFTGLPDRKETTSMKFTTPKQGASGLSKESSFSAPAQKPVFREKEEAKSARTKKRIGKLKKSALNHQTRPVFNRQEGHPGKVEPESPGDYSPMDYSPYRENSGDEQCSREASVASDEPFRNVSRYSSNESQKSHSIEDLVFATEHMVIDKGDKKHNEAGAENVIHAESHSVSRSTDINKETLLPSRGSLGFQFEDADINDDSSSATMESEIHHSSVNIERQTNETETGYTFAPKLESFGESSFSFAASHFSQGPLSASKRHYRRKSRTKGAQASTVPNIFPFASTSVQIDTSKNLECTPSIPQIVDDTRAETNKISHDRREPIGTDAASLAAQEACEKWRIRGNQAYANGHFAKAEEYYTRGVNSISPSETTRSCNRALMLCYSNRAATRMSLGRMREALSDCMKAAAIEPAFPRAQIRAANCQLALGEIEDALKYFKKCLKSNTDACLDPKIITEASDGLKKAQRVSDCIIQSDELLPKRTPSEVTRALELISDALLISTQSDNLMEMKAEALLMLRRYEEVIQFCEQTLELAERNSLSHNADGETENFASSQYVKSSSKLWRWRLMSLSYFHLGKLEEALELLKKHEQVKPVVERYGNRSTVSASSFSDTVPELIRLKAAGNEAFQAGRHSEAVEHYTAALACSSESRPFAAVCFCNRAAAYQALTQITDAIADCSLAIALDPSYPKAISRRATLHEMIRDYGQAANDLHKLIYLLEKQLQDNQSGASGKSVSYNTDLNRARGRLSVVEDEARKGISLDLYLILGIEPSSSAADVKKSYRKAALRHHPDKAGQFLVRNENVDDVVWKEIAAGVHTDADRLFKMIGEAYTVLSDPTKRLQYDTEEELRIALKKGGSVGSTTKSAAEYYTTQYDKGSSRRQWRPYGSSYQHHQTEFSRSNR